MFHFSNKIWILVHYCFFDLNCTVIYGFVIVVFDIVYYNMTTLTKGTYTRHNTNVQIVFVFGV